MYLHASKESKSVATGAPTTFTVESTGDELQFEWQRNYRGIETLTLTLRIYVEVGKGNNRSQYRE